MAIWYIDPENGNDSNDGLSFANRKKQLDNPSGFADGDEIRIIKTSDPTSIGNATWQQDATFLNSGIGSRYQLGAFTGQASGSPTSVVDNSHGLVTGDVIYSYSTTYAFAGIYIITKVDDNTFTLDGTENAAQTSSTNLYYAKINAFCVKLANSPIKNILCHQGGDGSGDKDWTAVQGTTNRETTYYQSGYRTGRNFKPGNGASGKVAYCQLDNALDLSGYQQISLKVLYDYVASSQRDDAGVFSLRLCTDTQGDTSVHTVSLIPSGSQTDKWHNVTVDLGTNLNSSIQSIALYADIALAHANTEIILDNIIACKAKSSADSLTLQSLIGKGNTHNSVWYQTKAIIDKVVLLESDPDNSNFTSNSFPKTETTETVTTYKREPYINNSFYNSTYTTGTGFIKIEDHYNFSISGGWNTTDMSSQDSNSGSWLGYTGPLYTAIHLDTCGKYNISNIGTVKGYYGFYHDFSVALARTRSNTISNCSFLNSWKDSLTNDCLFDNCIFNTVGTEYHKFSYGTLVYKNCTFIDTVLYTYDLFGRRNFVGCTFRGAQTGLLLYDTNSSQKEMKNFADEFSNCTFKRLELAHGEDWLNHDAFSNCTFVDINLFDAIDGDSGFKDDRLPAFSFINYNNTANDHRLYYVNCLVTSDSTVTQSGSGYSWKMTPLSTTAQRTRDVDYPLEYNIAKVAVAANAQVTATIYARRTGTATNDYVSLAALLINNGSVGLTSDIKSSALSASADTWQQLTLTFTPTVAGVATISALMSASSTSNSVFVDSLSITQA